VNGADAAKIMAHSFHKLFYHIVWATKERLPLIEEEHRERLVECVMNACKEREVMPMACNGMPDHLHLLVQLPPAIAPATFIGQVKGASAYAFNHHGGIRCPLKWQDGYGVISIRENDIPKVVRYIENQQQIHAGRKASRLLEAVEQPKA
jgi:putative transposase